MRNPFKKHVCPVTTPIQLETIAEAITAIDFHLKHDVRHTFEPKPPQPPPTQIVFRLRNHLGQEWVIEPMSIYGQSVSKVNIPMHFITGNASDPPVTMDARLYYQ